MLYCLGSDGDLACLDSAKGGIVWSKNLRKEFGGKPGTWAYAESPLVDGDVLICSPGGSEATMVALNKKDGSVIWKSPIPGADPAAYASAQKATIGGVDQYVQLLQKGVVGVDAKTGKFLWRYEKTAKGSPANIPTPVVHDDAIYAGGARTGGGMFHVKVEGSQFDVIPTYFEKTLPNAIGGSIRIGEYLYGTSGNALMCVEFATGKVKWKDESVAPASICFADGRLYLHGESGDVALVDASPQAYRELGRFTPPDQPKHKTMEKAWPYPVIANGRLYLRDLDRLWCYEIKNAS
jgi:outer membrane protein assembly factor BamB